MSLVSRRKFISAAVKGFGAFCIIPRHVLGGNGFIAPSDQLTRAVIGCGGMGRWHIRYPESRLLAVCDVDREHLQQALRIAGGDVRGYHDFRDVLIREDIDIIHIATPPHWHGLMAVAAAEAGKDIWCEKPMTRTISEGIHVVEAVKRNGSVFRINTWFRFESVFYQFGTTVAPIKKIVENRLLGWPLRVTVSADTGFNWKFIWSGKTDLDPAWIPEELDYDMWLGPAPYKPYHPHRVHGTFRGYWDYDGGGLGDMGQHYLDPVQFILEKDNTSPIEIEIDAPQSHPDAVGSWRRIVMRYADGCEIVLDGEGGKGRVPFIEGPEGKLYPDLESDIPDLQRSLKSLPDSTDQNTDFYECVRKRTKFALNEQNGHRSATLVNLGKIALQLGCNLKYNPEEQRFIDNPAANKLINQPMRSPWQIG